ncbi:uracil-DNA glycosylase [Schleiferilactobacillus harbinensis]|uniref:Uracil-DNA glycosylase n=2 Tax=Schleiferilactobacillus harbinensis TaxID=304207 RepID=A0A510TW11_9LACO|nr:uracil-DNA glycosylase [Schleiferilactobacillus harbinensis]HAY53522.1 uracil-DNA glycosylase [Lactobacillus sp.]KRM29353.1 uracil-DNA glycosylase [Schleiferilactobacillus harbinensis DSM 16991]MBO3090910.1 uracil-DNA glycosylase [Schleiferilactobacillus harbinensis]MCI1688724.1 uracil-DNA glycosylase [Schleiferilactobacillus harbinensis]MCI1782445.1 uracil-DNA glycosylase [Schleiferilactobacillus harbinensis]
MKVLIHNDWQEVLAKQFAAPYYGRLHEFLKEEYSHHTIYPEMHHIFQAFEWTPFSQVKVVILGQDPYHNPHQAHGLSFSVLPGVQIPPSLQNIYKELQDDLGYPPVHHGYLKSWAKQGVLLLNSVLTVRAGAAFSHAGKGWEPLTDAAIKALSARGGVVFILWGNAAKKKIPLIDQERNRIISSAHPSPLSASRGFFGSHPFSRANADLKELGESPINWQLPEKPDIDD